jgi:hypothetical protein
MVANAPNAGVPNDGYFQQPKLQFSYLKARGFDAKSGSRSGGIKDPIPVDLAAGTIVLRTYHDPARLFGEWWFTPHEMDQIINYFGRSAPAFGEGRSQGKGSLQATMAVRHDWAGNDPNHLGLVAAVRLTTPLKAFFGEGDVAPDATQKSILKPAFIMDGSGRQRGVRQIFLPDAWTYQSSFSVLEREDTTDSDLIRLVRLYKTGPMPFEQ